jgi:NADP-dependent 3-hydroxy acid dehydrogenase YdfG
MKDLKDRTALVTGSTSGIGPARALVLATRGARLLATGRNEQRAAGVVAKIGSGGGTAAYRLTALDDGRSGGP